MHVAVENAPKGFERILTPVVRMRTRARENAFCVFEFERFLNDLFGDVLNEFSIDFHQLADCSPNFEIKSTC